MSGKEEILNREVALELLHEQWQQDQQAEAALVEEWWGKVKDILDNPEEKKEIDDEYLKKLKSAQEKTQQSENQFMELYMSR